MSLRDLVKQDIARKLSREHLSAKSPEPDQQSRIAAGRERLQERRGQPAGRRTDAEQRLSRGGPESDDAASQAARAQRFAMMTAPVEARLDPIDVPHPYGDDREDSGPTMEDLVTGSPRDDRDVEDIL